MPRRFLNEFAERETISDVFVLGEKQLRHNRNGNLYLQMRLSDKSSTVNAMLWNATEKTASDVSNGDYVFVEGTTQLFNGSLQIIATKIRPAKPDEINEEDYVQVSQTAIDDLITQLQSMLRGMQDPNLVALANAFLGDEQFMSKFSRAPAAIKNHHAHHGGLLAHVVSLMQLTQPIANHYDDINNDQLLFGAFLHDIGKVDELFYERDLGYTDEGQLIGHLVMGVGILQRKIDETAKTTGHPFPEELRLRLQHMIVSHHGKQEFGSPQVPMTREALALHYLDDLDAKLQAIEQLIESDMNTESAWTPFNPQLGRKIFKGTSA